MIAEIIIDNPSSSVDMLFSYTVKADVDLEVGMRCKVPFGKGNTPTLGIVLNIKDDSVYSGELKEILEVLDTKPTFSKEQIQIALYIKHECICPISKILNLMMPSALRLKTVKYLELLDATNLDANIIKEFAGEQLIKITPHLLKYKKQLDDAINKKYVKVHLDATVKKTNKWIKKYSLNEEYYLENGFAITSASRIDCLNFMKRLGEALTMEEIIAETGVSTYLVNKLVEEGFLEEKYELASRIKNRSLSIKKAELKEEEHLHKYIEKYHEEQSFLYIENNKEEEISFLVSIIKENLKENKNTLIITPDILKGYEVSTYLKNYLSEKICCINSDLNEQEIAEIYEAIMDNEYQVVVTTPAFALWDYQELGCIIMMSEESKNYRNDQAPRYDLNLVMQKIANLKNIKIIYTSYAPQLSTYTLAMKDHLTLLYTQRVTPANIEIVNMMDALRNMESPILSNKALEVMNKAFDNNEAVLLILNNKGYSTSVNCRSCGISLKCPKCRVSLQYNKQKNELYCPSCYYKLPYMSKCPKCGKESLSYDGFGMEKVKEAVEREFSHKNVRILKDSFYLELEQVLDELAENKLDIIISSDVFSRSISSERLKNIIIVNLDVVLNTPSFDANHQAYAMLANAVSSNKDLNLVIQTYNPRHFVLKNFIINSYDNYYFEELQNRETLKVEPIYEVNRILVKGQYNEVFVVANNIKKMLTSTIKEDLYVIGPSYNYREKCVQLIVKHKSVKIADLYNQIYELYQKTQMTIIFDRYSKIIA